MASTFPASAWARRSETRLLAQPATVILSGMTDDTSRTTASAKPPPFFTAPPLVLLMALLLIALYAAYFFAPYPDQESVKYDFALAPERFWAPAGSPKVYPDVLSGLTTLVSTALLHGDWVHVLFNSLMLLSFGAPVARTLGKDVRASVLWMIIFLGSVVAGSALYLALTDAGSPYAVGAPGGTSGLIAAAFLLDPYGMKRKLWSREFLTVTGVVAALNAVLTFMGPQLLGIGIAWEAHVGGYITGAILMAVLPVKGFRPPES